MIVSPVALVCTAVGAVKIVHRVDIPEATLRYEARLARVGAVVMSVFLVGACMWVGDGGPGPRDLFHVGAIDVAGLVVMALALAVACRAVLQAGRSGLALSPN
jgi:hypothetical protein